MDSAIASQTAARTASVEVVGTAARSQPVPMAPQVAETMRRVHARLRDGAAPSYETLMALGAASIR